MPQLILASKSPRRRELLAMVTPHFAVCDAHVDEAAISAATPALLAGELALAKARAAFAGNPTAAVIGCDTVVELEGKTLGKPSGAAQAAEMIGELAGRMHLVHTGVAVLLPGQADAHFVETTRVWFAPVPQEDILAYVATPEPYDKAGGYGIQGFMARFIPRIEGCYYNVMGLPVAALYKELHRLGLA